MSARPPLRRTVRTLVGDLEIERPYFYCRYCPLGTYPLDAVLGLSSGQIQLDVQQAAADLATEMPYETASAMLGRLSGIWVSSERVHTVMHQVADSLSVFEESKSEVGMDHYEIRTYEGWHHHMLVSMLAHFFLWRLKIRRCPMELWGTTGNRTSLYISKALEIPMVLINSL